MSDELFDERGEAPTVEVRVYRHGALVQHELCESEEQAALVVDAWSEVDDVAFEVEDLGSRHRPGDVLGPEPAELRDEDYLEDAGREALRRRYE